ncbi:MAG: hypothetical protein K8F91_04405 [Candidatus Obscuribacterales bacterium]|nr:hypothetical protein [Candidatus Obscuribacterales bacterium]
MFKNILRSILFGIFIFVILVVLQHFFGINEIHFTNYPAAEDAAVYMAIGFLIGLIEWK